MTAIIFGMRPIIADNHGSVWLAVLSFSYDGDGLMTSAANSSGAVSNEYDDATGWLTASRGADGTEVSYSRRCGGSVASITSAAGTTSYAFDTAGRKTHVASPSGSFAIGYCGWNGKISASTNSHGFVVQYAYDIMDRVTNIAWRTASGATLGGIAYEYDAVGRITARSLDVGTNSFDRAYAYDDLDRLVFDGGIVYTYDAAGNRMTRTEDGATVTYTLGVGDRLASWTGGTYTHDAAGNVTRIERDGRPTLDLTWNSQYQLVSVATNGVFTEGYEYDALGRRASTRTLEGTTRHVYDNNWQVIADLDEDGDVVASYTWGDGIDNLLAVSIGGATYYPLTDIQGTVWGYVDSQNNVAACWEYDAWGNVVDEEIVPSASALAALRYRFQGREWSAATGLVHFRMRWYDPETGRWLSKDPIGLRGGINIYAFCENVPLLFVDPIGLSGIDESSCTVVGGRISPIIFHGRKVYPGNRCFYGPDAFGHGRFPDGKPIQPHIDQIFKNGSKIVRFDLDGNPLKPGQGFVPKSDRRPFMQAVKDVLRAIGAGAATGIKSICVPILLCPSSLLYQNVTEDGDLVL